MKDNLDDALHIDYPTALHREAERLVQASRTEDHKEAVRAFVEKRKPVFVGKINLLSPPRVPALRRQGLVIVATLATAYVASHFFRASNVTIGLDLMRDLGHRAGSAGRVTGPCSSASRRCTSPRLSLRPLRSAAHVTGMLLLPGWRHRCSPWRPAGRSCWPAGP